MRKGSHFTVEQRQKLSEAQKGRVASPETRLKMSQSHKGRVAWNKGCKPSDETRQKLSNATRGANNPFWGKHHTEETLQLLRKPHNLTGEQRKAIGLRNKARAGWKQTEEAKCKIGKAHKGMIITREMREAVSKANTGRPAWNKGIKGIYHPSEESRRKLSKSLTGLIKSEATRRKLSISHKGKRFSPEHRAKLSLWRKGRSLSEETKYKIGQSLKGKSKPLSYSWKLAFRWANPEYKDRVVKATLQGANIRPNKPETTIKSILDRLYPNEWKYTGDGSFILAGLNPDFINVNGQKKLIECFGTYWHGQAATKHTQREDVRGAIFARYGFDLLIIWEHELKDIPKVTERIKEFNDRVMMH